MMIPLISVASTEIEVITGGQNVPKNRAASTALLDASRNTSQVHYDHYDDRRRLLTGSCQGHQLIFRKKIFK